MSPAAATAALAAALGVAGGWDAIAAAEDAQFVARARRLLRPLRAAGDGRAPTAPEHRRLAVLGAGVLLAAGWWLAGPLAGCLLAAAGPWAVQLAVKTRRRRWQAAMVAGAPPTARALSDALAGGHSLRSAIDEAACCVEGAAGAQLRVAAAALALGETTDAVLETLRRAVTDPAWDTIVAAIGLQRRAGGDLARLLRELATTLEDQQRVEADARGAMAQARFTGLIVAVMPAFAAALVLAARPQIVSEVAGQPIAIALVGVALVLIGCGLLAIRRIAAHVAR